MRTLAAIMSVTALALSACTATGAGSSPPDAESTSTTRPAGATVESLPPAATATPPSSTTPRANSSPAPLVVWVDPTHAEAVESLAQAFGDETDTAVAVVRVDTVEALANAAAPEGAKPDLLIGSHTSARRLAEEGSIRTLDPSVLGGAFAPSSVQAFTFEDGLWGVPVSIDAIALLRNPELAPVPPATFEELEDAALDLLAAEQVEVGLALQQAPGDPFHNYPLFSALGGYVFGVDESGRYDPDDLGIDSKAGLAAAEQFARWSESGLLDPTLDYGGMIEVFASGRAAFAITGRWAIEQEIGGFAQAGVPHEVEPIPPVAGGTARPFVAVQGAMLTTAGANPDAAERFLTDVLADEPAQLDLYQASGLPPARLSALGQASPEANGFGRSAAQGEPLPDIPELGMVWQAWTAAYDEVLNGTSDPGAAFESAADEIRALIAAT